MKWLAACLNHVKSLYWFIYNGSLYWFIYNGSAQLYTHNVISTWFQVLRAIPTTTNKTSYLFKYLVINNKTLKTAATTTTTTRVQTNLHLGHAVLKLIELVSRGKSLQLNIRQLHLLLVQFLLQHAYRVVSLLPRQAAKIPSILIFNRWVMKWTLIKQTLMHAHTSEQLIRIKTSAILSQELFCTTDELRIWLSKHKTGTKKLITKWSHKNHKINHLFL